MKLNKVRSYKWYQNHAQDKLSNLGYKYWENGILNRVISRELFSNPIQDVPFRQIERLIESLVNTAKQVRIQFSIAHDKDTIFVN
jgi:hypothetical protein